MVSRLRMVLVFSALLAAAALGVAFASEWWGGLVPCALCLVERWPYRIAIALGLVGAVLPRPLARLALAAMVLVMISAATRALVHVGVEAGAWHSPLPECAAPHFAGGSVADRLSSMRLLPSQPCDEPVFLIAALPLSMAAMNLIFALGCAVSIAWFLYRTRRSSL